MMLIGGSVRTTKENADAFLLASEGIGLEINADKIRNMIMSRDQNSKQNHNMNIDNSSFEIVEELKFLGTTLTN